MASYLIGSTPIHGHVAPMLAIGAHLVRRGHRVTMVTGSRFRDRVEAAGIDVIGFSGRADFDDRDPASYLPDQHRHPPGIRRAQYDIRTIFIETIPDQFRSMRAALEARAPDAILVDGAFAGIAPMLFGDAPRPPIIGIGVLPLAQMSRDVAPAGMGLPPSATPLGRLRNRTLNLVARDVLFRATQEAAGRAFAEVGARPPHRFIMDLSSAFDAFLQLNAAAFEYPRSDLSPNVRFVGPIPVQATAGPTPPWWGDLDGTRPVVHVTQGTIDNLDLGRLLRPTIDGLADDETLVVASTGGRPLAELGPLPSNARAAEYLPYDRLLPLVDVVVTNGGFGGVQNALSEGIPLVVAGVTEDKPEVAARVARTRAGISLRTGTPSAAQVAGAVRRVLSEPAYSEAARRQAQAIAECDPLATIEAELERLALTGQK